MLLRLCCDIQPVMTCNKILHDIYTTQKILYYGIPSTVSVQPKLIVKLVGMANSQL